MKYYEARDKVKNLQATADRYNKVVNRLYLFLESDFYQVFNMDMEDWEKFSKQMHNATKKVLNKYLDKYEFKADEAEQECARIYEFEVKEIKE